MLGKRSRQRGLFEADNQYLDFVGRDSFYGFLASQRGKLFRDEDFAEIYSPDNGRPSVAPSLLANALLLQAHDRVSDEEAKARADYDLRWKVALGIEVDERPFAKSTLQLFRAQLILKEKMRAVFTRSLEYAQQTGYLKARRLRVILDTTAILGRGAVKDTYNLLGDGIQQLCRALAAAQGQELEIWVQGHGFQGYIGSSLKGEAQVDWDDEQARGIFLQGIVTDAQRLMVLAQEGRATLAKDGPENQQIAAAGQLLGQLIDQDVELTGGQAKLKEGVSRDRIISVHDPEMRHGRKSHTKRFDGHKAALGVDAESQLITAVDVLPGNATDASPALPLTQASEQNTGLEVEETVGDCAFGDGSTRQEFADAQRKLVAKVPIHGRKGQIHKSQFHIDLEAMTCTCPAGHTTASLVPTGFWLDRDGRKQPKRSFTFPVETCAVCPLRPQCIQAKAKRGRTVFLHPQEALLQQARAFQNSPQFQPYRSMRQTAEHRLARLVQLGIRQARYFGRQKTLFQLLMTATVANLTLIATKTGQMSTKKGPILSFFAWPEVLGKVLRGTGGGWQHLVDHFWRLLAVPDSKRPVFG
ncbi:MAG: IS1182 family transposase [Desulfobaccales bacterium]